MSAVASPKTQEKTEPPITPRLGPVAMTILAVVAALLLYYGRTLGLFVLAAMVGVPLFALMGGGAALAWIMIDDPSKQHVRFIAGDVLQDKFAGSPILVTIPLFTFVGYLMAESKTPERIVRVSRAFVGWLPGGLAIVCIFASAFFTTLTGASGVTIVAIGGLLYPSLRKQNYPDAFSLGLVTTGGSLGLLLPPSLPILVYSLVAGVPINETFKAGLLPGALVMVILAIYAGWIAMSTGVKREPTSWEHFAALFLNVGLLVVPRQIIPKKNTILLEARDALWEIKWELLVPVIILGGLASGLTSLDESAAITALYTLVIEVFVYKDLSFRKDIPQVAKNSMSLAGAVILILAMANSLMNYVDFVRIPEVILHWLEAHTSLDTSWKFLIGLNLFLLVIGMLMDGFSAILVSVPLIIPIATVFRMNPFHLGMIFLLNLEIAYVCPPLGLNLYISSFRFERPVVSLYKVVLPFVGLLVIALGLVTYIPTISTYLLRGQVEEERLKDLASIAACERPAFEYDRLSCVQADPLNRKPCDARSEHVHCLAASSDDPDNQDYRKYCVEAYETTCIKDFWKDPKKGDVCKGTPWKEDWKVNKTRCNEKNGVVATPLPSAMPAPSSSAPGGEEDDPLMKAMLDPAGSGSAPAPSGSSSAPPAPAPDGEDPLMKDMLK